jgi:predicted ATP-dependent endonuclease of OLD family
MKIKEIRIQNFKSIEDITLKLNDLNVFIGPNGSGKSNCLKIIPFLYELFDKYELDDISEAKAFILNNLPSKFALQINSKNPKPLGLSILMTDNSRKEFVFKIEIYSHRNMEFAMFYGVFNANQKKQKLNRLNFGLHDINLIEESFDCFALNTRGEIYLSLLKTHSKTSRNASFFSENYLNVNIMSIYKSSKNDEYRKGNHTVNPNTILKQKKFVGNEGDIRDLFEFYEIYKPDVFDITQLTPLKNAPDYFMDGSCTNIVPFLDTLINYYPENYLKINTDLNKCINEYKSIRLIYGSSREIREIENGTEKKETIEKYTHKKIALASMDDNIFEAEELSEGTLYFIALLCIINQPFPPSILVLEEPETGIHPRRIREVIGFIQEIAITTGVQVIITTHSPLILKEFNYDLSSIHVFDKSDNKTTIQNLKYDIADKKNQELRNKKIDEIDFAMNLDENWINGLIDGVPND